MKGFFRSAGRSHPSAVAVGCRVRRRTRAHGRGDVHTGPGIGRCWVVRMSSLPSLPIESEPMVSPGSGAATATAAAAAPVPPAAAPLVGSAAAKPAPTPRTIWGLDPFQLYTRYWAAMGVQVVRQGEPSPIVTHAELFLLTEPKTLVLFQLQSRVMDALNWINPPVMFLRLHATRPRAYRMEAQTDE